MMKVMKHLNHLAMMIGLTLLFTSCYAADAACLRKHRHHRHHHKRDVVVVHRFASSNSVSTDSSTFNLSMAMAELTDSNDRT